MDGGGHDDGRPSLAALLPRVALVVALASAAALALRARHGLDWTALADPPDVRWGRAIAGAFLLLFLLVLARGLLARLRRPKPRPAPDDRTEPEGEPVPLLLKILAVLVVLAALAVVWQLIGAIAPSPPVDAGTTPPPDPGTAAAPSGPRGPQWRTVLAVAAGLLLVAALARLRRPGPRGTTPEDGPAPAPEELAGAVAAAEVALTRANDARAAIVGAYAAMAGHLEADLRRRGRLPSRADTPTELLDRAAAAGLVSRGPAGRLTDLFREARFSRHPMGVEHRTAAETALAAVREELTSRHG